MVVEEYRFLSISNDRELPVFVRLRAASRMDAIETFANRHSLIIRRIGDETVVFVQCGRRVFYSVSGSDPWMRALFG